ncbi:MAG: BamA/TamA family outer membrane protein, partial [Gemmatimonadetes bacterium]|nr:BamA/TamA family outer membrane protein [Gemmatimonadota bacterium]
APRSSSYYQLKLKQLRLAPAVSFGSGRKLGFEAGPVLKSSASDTTVNPGSIVSDPTNPASRPYGSGRFDQIGGRASFGIDTRDQPVAATKGFLFTGGASYYPSLLDIDEPFGEIHGAASAYLSPSANQTLALRVGAKKVWGRAPFYEAAFVGGRTVRGFRQQRFAGNASLYANAELRLFVTRFFVLLPGEFGVFGLTDVGRVFNPGEVSTADCTLSLSRACTWHASVGGGFWIAPIARSATVSVAFAKSAEGTGLYIGSGFLY